MWIIILITIVVFLFNVFRKSDSKTISEIDKNKPVQTFKDNVNMYNPKKYVNSDDYKKIAEEKEMLYNKYYAEYKNFDISTIEMQLELGYKSTYEEYTEDDKMKFKAQKTLISEKREKENLLKIKNQILSLKLNPNLVEYINGNYIPINEVDSMVRSIRYTIFKNDEKTIVNRFIELKNSMDTKKFNEIVFRQYNYDDFEELSFNYQYMSDGTFEIERKFKENGSEGSSKWCGSVITREDIDYFRAKEKEKTLLLDAISLYVKIIESETTPINRYISTAYRISIILGKQKLYETDYYFLSNVYKTICESIKSDNFGIFDFSIISERLEKADKKLNK